MQSWHRSRRLQGRWCLCCLSFICCMGWKLKDFEIVVHFDFWMISSISLSQNMLCWNSLSSSLFWSPLRPWPNTSEVSFLCCMCCLVSSSLWCWIGMFDLCAYFGFGSSTIGSNCVYYSRFSNISHIQMVQLSSPYEGFHSQILTRKQVSYLLAVLALDFMLILRLYHRLIPSVLQPYLRQRDNKVSVSHSSGSISVLNFHAFATWWHGHLTAYSGRTDATAQVRRANFVDWNNIFFGMAHLLNHFLDLMDLAAQWHPFRLYMVHVFHHYKMVIVQCNHTPPEMSNWALSYLLHFWHIHPGASGQCLYHPEAHIPSTSVWKAHVLDSSWMGTRFLSVEDFQLSSSRCHFVTADCKFVPVHPWCLFVFGLRILDLNCFVSDLMFDIGCWYSFVAAARLENFDRLHMLECWRWYCCSSFIGRSS